MNSIDNPDELSPAERFLAIALLLALGYSRLKRLDTVTVCIDSGEVDKPGQFELLFPSERPVDAGNSADGLDFSDGLVHCSKRVNTTKK